jgi:hypothetical protein
VRPASGAPKLVAFDLSRASGEVMLGYVGQANEWFRKQAVLEIGWRGMKELQPKLMIAASDTVVESQALEKLWALNLLGEHFDEDRLLQSYVDTPIQFYSKFTDPYVRRWMAKMIGERPFSWGLAGGMSQLKDEKHLEVRAQILATAKKLPAVSALPLLWSGDDSSPWPLWATSRRHSMPIWW